MKIFAPLNLTVLVFSFVISNIALSTEVSQNQSIKCQELKQRLATIKAKIKPVTKVSNGHIENYVLSGLVGTQISSQKQSTVDRQFRHLSNEYAQKCSK